jgi:hypothetical protein
MLYIILPTCFKAKCYRYNLCLKTIDNINKFSNYKCILVDNSTDEIFASLKDKQITEKILVVKQDNIHKKGGAIRQGILLANELSNNEDDIIAFQEPEKENMIAYYKKLIDINNNNYIVVPTRTEKSLSTYPKEQVLLEKFMNIYLSNKLSYKLDWTFGPILFTKNLSNYWLENNDKWWFSQIRPIFNCIKNVTIKNIEINYLHNIEQTQFEEDNDEYINKRIHQFNYWIEHFAD